MWQAAPVLLDLEQDGVPVAVIAELHNLLSIPRGLPLDPELLSAAGKIGGLAGLNRQAQRFLIHIGQHNHRPRPDILGNGGHQALFIKSDI